MNNQDGGSGDRHPIEQMGLALDRASSILSTLTACYDSSKHKFMISEDFVVHAVASIESFIEEAKVSHRHLSSADSSVTPRSLPTQATVFAEAFLLDNAKVSSNGMSGFAEEESTAPILHDNSTASTYDELLRKITAAEVFAAEGQINQQSNANAALLPLLKSLRHDLNRMRAA